jgi:hypothetical protein
MRAVLGVHLDHKREVVLEQLRTVAPASNSTARN